MVRKWKPILFYIYLICLFLFYFIYDLDQKQIRNLALHHIYFNFKETDKPQEDMAS